ncbi:unnamed protein product, partial [Dovyalis caffra]
MIRDIIVGSLFVLVRRDAVVRFLAPLYGVGTTVLPPYSQAKADPLRHTPVVFNFSKSISLLTIKYHSTLNTQGVGSSSSLKGITMNGDPSKPPCELWHYTNPLTPSWSVVKWPLSKGNYPATHR